MDWGAAARWEWGLLLLLVLGLGPAELVSVQRTIRRARPPEDPGPPPG